MVRKIVLGAWCALLVCAGPACSSSDSSGAGSTAELLIKCKALCDQQATASDCLESVRTGAPACRRVCAALIPMIDPDCVGSMEAVYACKVTQDHRCLDGGQFPVMSDSQACKDETDAYGLCQRTAAANAQDGDGGGEPSAEGQGEGS